jgi:hypothetical protein
MFGSKPPEKVPFNIVPWGIAGVVIAIVIVAIVVFNSGAKKLPPNAILPPDPYAPSLVLSGLQMSESTSLSGGKSTYIDGMVKNAGAKVVTAATVQVLFANDEAMPPQIETLALTLIRTHEPYVDTQMLADTPLKPGEDREFRLIFEDIHTNWNQQLPAIHVVQVKTREPRDKEFLIVPN